ncbi:MAG: H-NS histone family protein [Ideonella sp.]|jgi:DNA-binding protein H-NS|nr:H-NS histone family protein [Ideonella sp.]MBL0148929.1 H-NS histone family protein [Ideonella sp.]
MDTIQDLLAKRAELDKKIADARREERSTAIAKVRALMAEHGLTAADVAGKAPQAAGKPTGNKVAPKYRNKATGETWTGRGLQPKWLRAALESGKKLADFII